MGDVINNNKNTTIVNRSKNVVIGSDIQAEGDVNIGDVVLYSANSTPNVVIPKDEVAGIVKTLRKYVASGRMEDAIPILLDYTESQHAGLHSEALQLSGSWAHLQYKKRMGTLSNAEAGMEYNKINERLLSIIDNIR